jgi:hypothetical protein
MNYANNHEFERAEVIKNQVDSILILNERQIARD